MKVAAIQFAPELGNLKSNRKKTTKLIKQAIMEDANLVVLPELANSGYNFQSLQEAKACSEEYPSSETLTSWIKTLQNTQTHVIAGYNENDNGTLYNSSVIIGPNGVIDVYRKIHLFGREKLFFKPGDRPLKIHTIGDVRVGMIICFDWIFPELIRSLALMGADVICQSANLVLPYCQKVMIGRSIENRIYTITSNRIGTERKLFFTGQSQITDPFGDILSKAAIDREEIIYGIVQVEHSRNKQLNQYNNLFEDRRPKYYHRIVDEM